MESRAQELKELARYYNEKFYYKHVNNFKPYEVHIHVIGYETLTVTKFGVTINDTLIRASSLVRKRSFLSEEISELKWEGSLHEWWQAVADDAKNQIKEAIENDN